MASSMDEPSDLSSHHLSFLVKYLLPDTQAELQSLCHPLADFPSGAPGELLQSGSTAEGLCLPNMLQRRQACTINFNYDIDHGLCFGMPSGATIETWKHNDELKPGFCRLVKPGSDSTTEAADSDVKYYSTIKAKEKCRSFLAALAFDDFAVVDTPDERAALLMEHTDPSLGVPMDHDIIPAIAIEQWPDEVSEWKTRHRPNLWPSSDMVNNITKDWIHLVPKAHPSSQKKEIEWRLSTALAEIHLARSLKEEQRLSYLALKAIRHVEADALEGLSSYVLKTVLFWTCEKTPPQLWVPSNLGRAFFVLLDELIRCLKNGVISNYFIPERNGIENIDKDCVLQWVRKFEEVRLNPVPFLLRFHDIYKPLGALEIPLHEEEALRDRDRYRKGLRLVANDTGTDAESKETFLAAMFETAFCYAAEGKFIDLVPLAAHFESLRAIDDGVTVEATTTDDHDEQVLQLINFLEALVRYFTEADQSNHSKRMMLMIQTNLARLYHEASKTSETVTQKVKFLDLARERFSMIPVSVHHDASSALCLANFLRDEGRHEEAIIVLQTTRDSLEKGPPWCSYIVFNKFTAHTVDDYLTKEFQARQEIEYWVTTFTLYLLIACYVNNGQVSKARDLMTEMYQAREASRAKLSYADSCVLMGYCYLMFGDREDALRVFKEAVDDHGSGTAQLWLDHISEVQS